jgi:hypothetical protein
MTNQETPEPTQEKPTILRCSDCGERHIPDEDCVSPEQKDFVEGKWLDRLLIETLKDTPRERILWLQSFILGVEAQAYAQGEQDMLERAKEAMPKYQEMPHVLPPENRDYMYSLAQFNKTAGMNNTIAEALSALQALKK